jgi:hypothetical protein
VKESANPGPQADSCRRRLGPRALGVTKPRSFIEEAAVELHEVRLPHIAEYVTAFRALESRITPKQRRMLQLHHAASVV